MIPYRLGAAGVFIGWAAILIIVLVSRRRVARTSVRTRDRTGVFGIALQSVGFAIAFGGLRRAGVPPAVSSTTVQWIAAVVAIALSWASPAFMWVSIRALGRQWSYLPQMVEGHVLITTGPYAIVRHPIYASLFASLVATALALASAPALAAAAAFYAAGTIVRVRIEERLLIATFGEAYEAYARRVPAFVPFAKGLTRTR